MVSVQLLYCDRLQAFQLAELFPELLKIQTKLGPHKRHFQVMLLMPEVNLKSSVHVHNISNLQLSEDVNAYTPVSDSLIA